MGWRRLLPCDLWEQVFQLQVQEKCVAVWLQEPWYYLYGSHQGSMCHKLWGCLSVLMALHGNTVVVAIFFSNIWFYAKIYQAFYLLTKIYINYEPFLATLHDHTLLCKIVYKFSCGKVFTSTWFGKKCECYSSVQANTTKKSERVLTSGMGSMISKLQILGKFWYILVLNPPIYMMVGSL